MISGPGGPWPTRDLLRQYELGTLPKEMAEEKAREPEGAHDVKRTKEGKRSRRRWLRFWRRT